MEHFNILYCGNGHRKGAYDALSVLYDEVEKESLSCFCGNTLTFVDNDEKCVNILKYDHIKCEICNGSGQIPSKKFERVKCRCIENGNPKIDCHKCFGSGIVTIILNGSIIQCYHCNNRGKIYVPVWDISSLKLS
jgi:hypothetical protein